MLDITCTRYSVSFLYLGKYISLYAGLAHTCAQNSEAIYFILLETFPILL